jgi:hypothetical protein
VQALILVTDPIQMQKSTTEKFHCRRFLRSLFIPPPHRRLEGIHPGRFLARVALCASFLVESAFFATVMVFGPIRDIFRVDIFSRGEISTLFHHLGGYA